ncbi:lectin C-type domain-containing protein [Didymella exigua CBS 183.55]|uniref:Maintenance of telomere capping protein 6 n=1 Tax=Didymella exigua CBS 183.55 TaxID=1150837 RepID=A0A6A5RGS6_9PLEO|nr:lectin C-type domain-containing protein [Didymella exigua CBS 183.55]KAF1926952.1 lectin C-type domain-containing protein [Didymella exigua CBS 183.55]
MSPNNNLYDPDQAALNTRWIQPWSEAFRAQRDVGLRVPIDFHTSAAVSLTQACFVNNQFEHNAFMKCFSNLLGVGIPRFEVNVYWDALRSVWSLCPVQLPKDEGEVQNDAPVVSGPTISVSTGTANARVPETTATMPQVLRVRQDSSMLSVVASVSPPVADQTSSSAPAATSATAQATVISFPTVDGPPLLQIGRYNCTSQTTFGLLTGLLEDFLQETATTTGAAISFLNLNIYAAATLSDPDGPAPRLTSDQLPQSGDTLSQVVNGNLSHILYSASNLADQRRNLNSSWYNVEWENLPAHGYYQTSKNSAGNIVTESGWPTEALMEFQEFKRVIVSFGTVDESMAAYNITDDFQDIFPPDTITRERQALFATTGEQISGCFFPSSDVKVTSQTNSSFARASPPSIGIDANPDLNASIASVANLTRCGIIPFLNQSLAGTTADKNPLPYAAYVHSTLWSWAPGQPLNVTQGSSTDNRCAVMTNSPHSGRWEVADCANRYRAACQNPQEPYFWEVSSDTSDFSNAEALCRSPLQFAVPHTALQNAHLHAVLQRSSEPDQPIYVNLNQLGTADCWVIGINGTCPYLQSTDTNRTRIVVIPTVAAVIIFLCAALTFFIKCASNRREDRRGRGRKMAGGWVYEGVPS